MYDSPVGKSDVNHRLRIIEKIVDKLRYDRGQLND